MYYEMLKIAKELKNEKEDFYLDELIQTYCELYTQDSSCAIDIINKYRGSVYLGNGKIATYHEIYYNAQSAYEIYLAENDHNWYFDYLVDQNIIEEDLEDPLTQLKQIFKDKTGYNSLLDYELSKYDM